MKKHFLMITWALCFLTDNSESKEAKVGPCIKYYEEPGDCPDYKNIQIYLFTRKNRDNGQYIVVSEATDNISASHFSPQLPNKLILHGFNADMSLNVLVNLKEEYLMMEDMNVWMVNYPRLVQNSWCYVFAVTNISHVGRCLAQLIHALRRHSTSEVHVVGFSLGAHVANYLANNIREPKLDRITGLDPAGVLFAFRDNKYKLDASDAKFVDIVHTDSIVQGTIERSGHVDFFMNGGIQQSGCIKRGSSFLNCNHVRAVEYFTESLRSKDGFFGWPCELYTNVFTGSCSPDPPFVVMGEHCPSRSRGNYVVQTADDKPFALGNSTTNQSSDNINLDVE